MTASISSLTLIPPAPKSARDVRPVIIPPPPAEPTPEDRLLALFESDTAADIRHIVDLCSRPAIKAAAGDLSKRLRMDPNDALCAVILGCLCTRPHANLANT